MEPPHCLPACVCENVTFMWKGGAWKEEGEVEVGGGGRIYCPPGLEPLLCWKEAPLAACVVPGGGEP